MIEVTKRVTTRTTQGLESGRVTEHLDGDGLYVAMVTVQTHEVVVEETRQIDDPLGLLEPAKPQRSVIVHIPPRRDWHDGVGRPYYTGHGA